MESHNIGIGRSLSWERTPDGVEFRRVTEGLSAARVTLSAVAPRVVRIRITPGAVAVPKGFSYVTGRPAPGPWTVEAARGQVALNTAHLAVEATVDPWQLVFRTADGRLLMHEVPDDVNFAGHRLGPRPGFEAEGLPHDPVRRMLSTVETLLLDPEDHFYGGGEKFTRLDHVGRTIRIWNRNSYGARSELAYKNVPLLVGSRGYGLFVDVPTAVTFHLGSRSLRTYTIEAAGSELDYYVLAGTPAEILTAYTDLTGRPAVPPEWAFGLWASTSFVQFTESSVLAQAQRLRTEGIPCDVLHLDSFWQRALMWCDFEWDRARIADPRRLLRQLHDAGFHNCLWINPYVSLQSALYEEGATRGYFLRRPDGSVYDAVVWSQRTERGMGLCAIVDFTNVLEFPEDPAGYAFDLQYCLGRELLVSPVVHADGWVTTYLPRGRWMDWWSGAIHEGPTTIRRQVPLRELPLYLRENSLLVLGPERSHVGERPADPLTVEAFVTTEAAFTLRRDAGAVVLRCRRDGNRLTFEASDTPASFVLRVRRGEPPAGVTADGQTLPRLDRGSLDQAERGWTVEGETVAVKARARRIALGLS